MPSKHASPRQGHFHAVRFYPDDASLCQIVADFVHEGLAVQQPAIVIATLLHQEQILRCLATGHEDPAALQQAGELMLFDAAETMARFMVDGMPDQGRFDATIIPLLEKATQGRSDCTVRAYGEMVDLLWQAGMHAAAIRLEMFWNQLANTHRFSLLCGYSMGSFYKDAAYDDICDQHSHIVSAGGDAAPLT